MFLGIMEFPGQVDVNGYTCEDLEKPTLPNDFPRTKFKEVYHYVSFCKFPAASIYTELPNNTSSKLTCLCIVGSDLCLCTA